MIFISGFIAVLPPHGMGQIRTPTQNLLPVADRCHVPQVQTTTLTQHPLHRVKRQREKQTLFLSHTHESLAYPIVHSSPSHAAHLPPGKSVRYSMEEGQQDLLMCPHRSCPDSAIRNHTESAVSVTSRQSRTAPGSPDQVLSPSFSV